MQEVDIEKVASLLEHADNEIGALQERNAKLENELEALKNSSQESENNIDETIDKTAGLYDDDTLFGEASNFPDKDTASASTKLDNFLS